MKNYRYLKNNFVKKGKNLHYDANFLFIFLLNLVLCEKNEMNLSRKLGFAKLGF